MFIYINICVNICAMFMKVDSTWLERNLFVMWSTIVVYNNIR